MSKWSNFMAKLTGWTKPAPPPPIPSEEPPKPPNDPPREDSRAQPMDTDPTPPSVKNEETPPPPPPSGPSAETPPVQESSEDAMQQTPLNHPESSPRQALAPDRAPRRRINTDSAARLYARALIDLGEDSGKLDELASEVQQLDELLRSPAGAELEKLISTPALGTAERRDLLDRVFKGRISDPLYRFMQVVNRKGRLAELPNILAAFDQLLDEKKGIVEVDVHVAQRLSDDDAQAVTGRLSEALGKEIVLHQYVDESLIGGLVIRVGDRLIDGSVATQLKTMRKNLVEAGRTKARQSTAIQE